MAGLFDFISSRADQADARVRLRVAINPTKPSAEKNKGTAAGSGTAATNTLSNWTLVPESSSASVCRKLIEISPSAGESSATC